MKYLFFDIECSNCFNGIGKMCEFGYVLTDEKFSIIKKDTIPMSPGRGREDRFHLRDRMKREDISLAYDEEYYFECKEFFFFYKKIRKLFCDSDTICFAYSADNDILHMYHACTRYNLEPFDYECYDVQKLADVYLKSKNQTNLKKAYLSIVGREKVATFQEHLSEDDAKMAADILEALCALAKKTPMELLNESQYARYEAMDFINKFVERNNDKKARYAANKLYKKEALKNSKNAELIEYKGKRYNICENVKSDPEITMKLIKSIKEQGNIVVNSLEYTDVLIVLDENNKNIVKERIGNRYSGIYMTMDEVLKVKI